MDENKLSILNKGKMAELAFNYFDSIIEREKNLILTKIKSCAKQEKHDFMTYTGSMCAINALEDLQASIRKDIRASQAIQGEILNADQ